ncbi:MAG TPA: hypothetical protein VET29_06165, partial [Actinophytocola sp.]|nr:hypothetical protein [Actinophytocola sp.]
MAPGKGSSMDPDGVDQVGNRFSGRGNQIRDGVGAKLNIGASAQSAGVFGQVAMGKADQAIKTARDSAERAATATETTGQKVKATAQAARNTEQSNVANLNKAGNGAGNSRPPQTSGGANGTSRSGGSSGAGGSGRPPTTSGGSGSAPRSGGVPGGSRPSSVPSSGNGSAPRSNAAGG